MHCVCNNSYKAAYLIRLIWLVPLLLGFVSLSGIRKNPISALLPGQHVYELVEDSGATVSMAVDGSVVPVNYEYEVPNNQDVIINRINFLIIDAGIVPTDFGGINGGVTNGIIIQAIDADGSTILISFINGMSIKSNAEFHLLAGTDVFRDSGPGEDILDVSWVLSETGRGLFLTAGQRLRIIIQDDLTGLTDFRAMVQGVIL